MANTKWFWMKHTDIKYSSTNYKPTYFYNSTTLTNAWKYLSTSSLGDNAQNKNQSYYAYIRIGYYWDTIDKTNRTAKIHIQLELVEYQNYVCINNKSLLRLGMNIVNYTTMNQYKVPGIVEYKPYLTNVPGYSYAYRGNGFWDTYVKYYSNGKAYPYGYIGYNNGWFNNSYNGKSRSLANHIIILDQQEATISYNAKGEASATIGYDIYFGYQVVSNGRWNNIYGVGNFVVKDAPKIPAIITGLSIRSSNSDTITPKSMSLTGLTNNATKYTISSGKSKTFGATITSYNTHTFEQTFTVSPTNAGGTVTATSSDSNVASISGSSINVENSSNRKFSIICKQPGTTIITISGNGKSATMTLTVKADNTIVWSSSNSDVVSVVGGTVTANADRSGKATITAKCKGNSSVSKTLNIESLLKPKSYSVIADKSSMYPGETIRFRGIVNPISNDASKSVSTVYRPVDWTILNNSVTDTHNVVPENLLKSGTDKSGNFEVRFKLNSNTNTKDYILFNMRTAARGAPHEDWRYLVDLEANKKIPINAPKISLNNPKISLNKNHLNLPIGDTTIVFVMTTPSNGNFTLEYDKSCLQVTRDKNRLTIKSLKVGDTTLRVIGNMTILPYMKQPVAILSVKVTDIRINSLLLSYVSNANVRKYDKSIKVNSFTLKDESNIAIPSTINAANDGKIGESQIVTVNDFGYQEFSAKDTNLKYTPSDARCKITITSSDTSIVDIDSSNKNFNSNGDKYIGGNINLIYKNPGTAIITAEDSVTGLNSSITVTVESDYSVSWSTSPTNIVKVTKINDTKSKLEALPNINGKANLFAKVGECTKSITFNNHRLVDSIEIKPKSNGYYIGEKPEVVITFKPYVKGNPSKSASSTIINGSTIDVKSVKQSLSTHKINNENPNPFTFNNLTINKSHDTDKYEIVVHCTNKSEIGTINKAVTASYNIKVLAPTISVDPDIVDVKVSKTATMKVTTLPKNMEWTIPKIINATYENKFIDGKVIFTGKDRCVKQTYTITSKAPIMESYMNKASTDFSLIVSDNNLLTITQPKDQEYSLLPNNIAFTDRTNINDYDTKYVKKDDFDYDSDKIINVNTIMSFAECEKKITINYIPKVCTDTLIVSSSNTEIVDIKDGYLKRLRPNYNGKITIVLICRKEGKSTITLQSKNIKSVNTKFNVNVISNKNVIIRPEDIKVVKVNKELKKYNHRSTFKLITQHYNGSTYLKAIPEANRHIFARLKFTTRLTPTKLDLYITDDKRSIVREISSFAKDKVNVTALMEPNNTNNSNLQINTKYRLINYSYMYYDNGIGKSITSNNEVFRKNNENKLTDNFVFTIPTDIKADSYTITAQSEKNKSLKSSIKINVVQPDINIEGQVIDSKGNKYIDVYLANINDTNSKLVSQKDLIVDVIPSTQPYKIEPNTKNVQDGYSCKQDTKDRSIIKVVATPIRNLKTNSKNSASAINSVYKNNKAPNVSGVSFNVKYNGIIQKGRTSPEVKVNVFTLQYFGIPEILNTNIDNEIHYYNDVPKIIFKLPEYNDLDNLDEIEIKFKNGTFKFSENPELFSIYYNGNTNGHSIISSAIVDFKDNKNSGYCVFSPSKIVSDGDVVITFKATKFDNIPDASKKIKVKKKSLPTLPNIGDKIRLDTIKPYLNAIKDVLLPYLGENSNTIDRFGIDFNNLNFIGSTEKNKETAIKAMPFFKMLFILNKYLMELRSKATFTNNKSNVTPSNLSFESVRNMYVKQSSLISWYETYVDASSIYFKNSDEYLYTEFKRLMNIDLYNDYKDRKDLDNSYPVMVDDSNDFVGDISYGFENKFKSTGLYSKYTISPLTEIIKALKQF